jgi:Xaa-Pro aminopeptidase
VGLVGTGHVAVTPELIETLGARLARAASGAAEAGWDALIVTPGANLVYLIGYDAVPLERITALVIPAQADPFLIVPRLERLAALASPAGDLQYSRRDLG